jgi:hypothetical protein
MNLKNRFSLSLLILCLNGISSFANPFARKLMSGSGYIPGTSLIGLTGIINGTQLILTKADSSPIKQIGSVGVFTFTTHNMEETWHNHWSGVWDQNVYTPTMA